MKEEWKRRTRYLESGETEKVTELGFPKNSPDLRRGVEG